jgi:hypothetical protein
MKQVQGMEKGKAGKWEKRHYLLFYSFPFFHFSFFPSLHKERLQSAKILQNWFLRKDACSSSAIVLPSP